MTSQKLFESCKERLRFIEDEDIVPMVRILMSDGWLMFNNDSDETIFLPYGRGVPHYDAEVDIQHPFWHTL